MADDNQLQDNDKQAINDQTNSEEAPGQRLAQEYLDGWKRERAAFANYKKDELEHLATLQLLLKRQFFSKLLPILDSFELALKATPQDLQASDWFKGYAYIKKQFADMLKDEGIQVIETQGKEFDPHIHEAIETSQEQESQEDGKLIVQEELQKGYKLGEFVLRPARVRVGKELTNNHQQRSN